MPMHRDQLGHHIAEVAAAICEYADLDGTRVDLRRLVAGAGLVNQRAASTEDPWVSVQIEERMAPAGLLLLQVDQLRALSRVVVRAVAVIEVEEAIAL